MELIRPHPLIGMVDHNETYGRHVVADFARRVHPQVVVDVGAGPGHDLAAVKQAHPQAKLVAVDFKTHPAIAAVAHETHELDVERDRLPFGDESVDLIISNQTLEHTKDVWWIFHEMSRVLQVGGGHLIVGVPNIASLHSRLMLLAGMQPSQQKTCSAHVRSFSKGDLLAFIRKVWPSYELAAFGGSQFYPFPRAIARPLATAFPTLAVSIFFLFRKTAPYGGEFIQYPRAQGLETNFYLGG